MNQPLLQNEFDGAWQSAVTEERSRLAREIHDTLAQGFAGILLHLDAAGRDAAPDIGKRLARVRELAKCGLEDARRMLLGLRPRSLDGVELSVALRQLAEAFSRDCGIACSFTARGRALDMPERVQDELYRVAQEALCNARKHSRANHVSISLNYSYDSVLLTIRDNGRGFPAAKLRSGARGFGIPTMCERAHRVGGTLRINPGTTAGTEVEFSVLVAGRKRS